MVTGIWVSPPTNDSYLILDPDLKDARHSHDGGCARDISFPGR